MKYNDNGIAKDIRFKTSDTLPIGTEVEYNGSTVPDGWVEVDDDIIKRDTVAQLDNVVSRNLFDKNKVIGGWIRTDGVIFNEYQDTYCYTEFIELKPNTTYTLNLYNITNLQSAGILQYNSSKTLIETGIAETQQIYTFTTKSTTKYVRFTVRQDSKNNVQLEEGAATPYVPYLNLEEAMKENQVYSTNETRIGTWIDGKPVYRKVTQLVLSNQTGFKSYNLGINNIDFIVKQYIQFWYPTAAAFYKAPYYESGSYYVVGNVDKSGLAWLTQNGFGGSTLTFIVEYTKTTD